MTGVKRDDFNAGFADELHEIGKAVGTTARPITMPASSTGTAAATTWCSRLMIVSISSVSGSPCITATNAEASITIV